MIRILLVLVLLGGCASVPGLYADIGAGYKLATTSAVLQPECHEVYGVTRDAPRSCGGDNPTAHFKVGYEFERRKGYCEIEHWSHFLDGGKDRETHKDELQCFKRFGGR